MPKYIDRHDISENERAEVIINLDQNDLKVQHEYNCKGLMYWFDAVKKTAFCLMEVPDRDAIMKMHNQAHGEAPYKIIEVDGPVAESFLGHIEDPGKSKNIALNISKDPDFRIIMVIKLEGISLKKVIEKEVKNIIDNQYETILHATEKLKVKLVRNSMDHILISFDSVSNAVLSALDIQALNKEIDPYIKLHVDTSSGVPVCEKVGVFEDTIQLA